MKFLDFEIRQTIPLVRSHKIGSYALKRLQKMRTLLEFALIDQVALPFDVRKASCGPYKKRGPSVTIDGWDGNRIPEDFRVDTRDELWDLFACFQFPDVMRSKWGHVFTGEEVFLFGMYRLCNLFKLQNKLWGTCLGSHLHHWPPNVFIAFFVLWSIIGDISLQIISTFGFPFFPVAHILFA